MRFLRLPSVRALAVMALALFAAMANAQDRCGTVDYNKTILQNLSEQPEQFEKWLQRHVTTRQNQAQRTQAAPYKIPVVVHVIHHGETLGSGANIPDAQIISQIAVLNKDYQRTNADASGTPNDFLPVAGAMDIEFVLAKQDPDGQATSGIVRVKGSKTSWSMNDNYALKALSYWPAEDYLNIWVCQLTSLLGYAQFPVSNLEGLENASTNRLTDGVVIAYDAFGSSDDGTFNLLSNFDKGRTATHEVGHFLGLRHIWGDDDGACTGSDYVDDTPNQGDNSGGCPTHPRTGTCSSLVMFQNYMDYTNDACMNLFTINQVDRMSTIIENSPRRASLLTSPGLSNPAPVNNDLGIRNVLVPGSGACTTAFAPQIELRNNGVNSVTAAVIRVVKDGATVETKSFTFSPAIASQTTRTATFSPLSLTSGTHEISFEIVSVNGTTDGKTSDDTLEQSVYVAPAIDVPFREVFVSTPASWQIVNPDQNVTWTNASTPAGGHGNAMTMDFFSYEDNFGEIDALITPRMDFTAAPAALLTFDVAYAPFQGAADGLRVVVLTNCNDDINAGTVVYDKAGTTLATTSTNTEAFTPTSASQWRTEKVDLSSFVGQENVRVAFVGINDWGNNLYLDNATVSTDAIYDVALEAVVAPNPVTCLTSLAPRIQVANLGTLINTLTVTGTVNGTAFSKVFTDLALVGGTSAVLTLDATTLKAGTNTITFTLESPNGADDLDTDNNSKTVTVVVNNARDGIPYREQFEGNYEQQWTSVNPAGGMTWQTATPSTSKTVMFNAFANETIGDQAWLATPVLDFSSAMEASVSFDVSYAARGGQDELRVLVSPNCGEAYTDTLATYRGTSLSKGLISQSAWAPTKATDWTRNTINLSTYAGLEDVRLAFVVTNANGNNIYLDNVEFYVTATHLEITDRFTVYPNPARVSDEVKLTFNLPEKGPVDVQVIDATGHLVLTETVPDVLNQTFTLSMPQAGAGLYVVRIISPTTTETRKLIILN